LIDVAYEYELLVGRRATDLGWEARRLKALILFVFAIYVLLLLVLLTLISWRLVVLLLVAFVVGLALFLCGWWFAPVKHLTTQEQVEKACKRDPKVSADLLYSMLRQYPLMAPSVERLRILNTHGTDYFNKREETEKLTNKEAFMIVEATVAAFETIVPYSRLTTTSGKSYVKKALARQTDHARGKFGAVRRPTKVKSE
jgi:ABC-type multidrug transport system fused ATPase/permease subunit